jgi:hypothetical protein
MDPPVDPPGTFQPAQGRLRPSENALDERDRWRLPGSEPAIFSRGLARDKLPWCLDDLLLLDFHHSPEDPSLTRSMMT